MSDNKTPHMSSVYDEQVRRTIPEYDLFHDQVINLVNVLNNSPNDWLDTGCGTGTMVIKALEHFKDTFFVLADPSLEMLKIAKTKLTGKNKVKSIDSGSLELDFPDKSFDVITAIMSHHYLDPEIRRKATENCFRMLKTGGIFVTFENIKPNFETGIQIGLERWKRFQLACGKSVESVENHLKRFNTEYFPITLDEHLNLLKEVGFKVFEILWVSYMQAGFYAIKL